MVVRMKSSPFILDRRLYELLQDGGYAQFTTCDLRDAYAAQLQGTSFKLADVRRHVYDQIRRMLRVGWIVPDKDRRKRDQIYHLQACPKHLRLKLVDGIFESNINVNAEPQVTAPVGGAGVASPMRPDMKKHLQALLNETRLDFLAAMGEAERYKQLLAEMPQLREKVEPGYLEARDRSSRLLGHLRAVENTLNALDASQ